VRTEHFRRTAVGFLAVAVWALAAAPGRCQQAKPDPAIDPLETRVKAFLEGISAGETTSAAANWPSRPKPSKR
jgi:hypothetical protein